MKTKIIKLCKYIRDNTKDFLDEVVKILSINANISPLLVSIDDVKYKWHWSRGMLGFFNHEVVALIFPNWRPRFDKCLKEIVNPQVREYWRMIYPYGFEETGGVITDDYILRIVRNVLRLHVGVICHEFDHYLIWLEKGRLWYEQQLEDRKTWLADPIEERAENFRKEMEIEWEKAIDGQPSFFYNLVNSILERTFYEEEE